MIFTRGFVRHFIGTTVAKSLFPKEKKDTGRKFLEIRFYSKSGPMKSLLSVSRSVDQSVIFFFAKTVHNFFLKLYVKIGCLKGKQRDRIKFFLKRKSYFVGKSQKHP